MADDIIMPDSMAPCRTRQLGVLRHFEYGY